MNLYYICTTKLKNMINDKIDGRKNNGGHKTAGRKKKEFEDKKIQIEINLSPNEFKKRNWKSVVCTQFENKMNNKLNNTCELNK